MAKEGKPAGRKPGGGGKVVTDSRFAAVHYDPRFQRFPKAKAKVEIDERFAGEAPPPPLEAAAVPRSRAATSQWQNFCLILMQHEKRTSSLQDQNNALHAAASFLLACLLSLAPSPAAPFPLMSRHVQGRGVPGAQHRG